MDKNILFFGKTETGVFCRAIFQDGIMKTAEGRPIDNDWDTAEEIRQYIRTITPDDRKKYCYVLVNALGAGEYYGSNINADYFPWDALSHEGDDYGYKTFLNAHAFQHHVNKDPAKAIGSPVLSVLNVRMKRVELIVRIDRAKAKLEGADGIVNRIDAGEFPDVSMGCRVPFDVCSVCGHKSKTRDDYCEHMSPPPELRGVYGPNKILPDGRRICVLNTYPRFFDISFVFIGADKTAKVMTKLAQRGNQICMGPVCAIGAVPVRGITEHQIAYDDVGFRGSDKTACMHYEKDGLHGPCGGHCDSCSKKNDCHMDKVAEAFSVKTSEQKKLSEIIKEVPTGAFSMNRLPDVEKSEPSIPQDLLDDLCGMPLPSILSGMTGLGMVLKPAEFQHIVLRKMGEDDILDKLEGNNQVFKDSSSPTKVSLEGDMGRSASDILKPLLGMIRQRTAFGPSFTTRVIIIRSNNNSLPTPTQVEHPLLDKISSAYLGYRKAVLEKVAQAAQVVESDPKLREAVLGDGLVSIFSKTASVPTLSLDSVAYMMGAYLKDRGLSLTETINPRLLVEGHLAQRF